MEGSSEERRLEALLNDERARRAHAEQSLARERERVAVWRRRAEERAARLDRLTASRPGPRRRFSSGRRPGPPPGAEAPAQDPPAPAATPAVMVPAVPSVLAVADEAGRSLLEGLVSVAGMGGSTGLEAGDLVAVAPSSLPALGDWVVLERRPPLLVVDDGTDGIPASPPPGRSVVVTNRPERWVGWTVGERPVVARGLLPVPDPEGPLQLDEGVVIDRTGRVVALQDGPGRLLDAVTAWVPISALAPPGSADGAAAWLRRETVRTRRRLIDHGPRAVAARLLQALGVDAPERVPQVTAVLISNRPADVEPAIRQIGAQTGVDLGVVVALHGIDRSDAARQVLAETGLAGDVVEMDGAWPLGRCMNAALERVSTPLWAKFDDDDVYGPHHLIDSVAALEATGADLAGKSLAYVHFEADDSTHLYRQGAEDAWDQFVFGATFVGTRSLWEQVRFPHRFARIDSVFLSAARRLGARVWSTTRDEYMVIRRGDAGHTWGAHADLFRSASTPAWDGKHPERVVVE